MQNDQNYRSDRIFKGKANECYLLCISGLDDNESPEIYETYMHSDQIAYAGKKSVDGTPLNLGGILEHITALIEVLIISI